MQPERTGGFRVPASWVAIAAFFVLVALPRPAIPLVDGDVYWHIRAGEAVLEQGAVPTTDTWSVVGEGMRWISQDWLSNVILALGYRMGDLGPTALSVLWAAFAAAAVALLWIGFRWRMPDAGWLGRIIWLAAGLIVAGPTLGVRVQVVDLPLAAAVLIVLWRYVARPRVLTLAWLPLLTLAWANLHAGWPLVFLLGGAFVVGEAVDRLGSRHRDGTPLTFGEIGRLVLALAISVPMIAINPNGVALYRYPIDTSLIAAHRDFVSEWQPPDPGTFIGQVFIGFVLVMVLPALWFGWRRLRMADLFVIAGLTLMIATSARFLLLAPLVAATAGLALDPAAARSRIGRRLGPMLQRLGSPRRSPQFTVVNLVLVGLVVTAGLLVVWARVGPRTQSELVAEHMPVSAVDWILANDPGDRPLNQYSWGGYLGLRQPNEPIYIDGRSDIYGDGPIRRYAEAVRLETDPQVLLDRHAIDYVIFDRGQPLAEWLNDSPGWERVYADELAGVWVRRSAGTP